MDKNTSLKRHAHKLAQKGEYALAAEEYTRLAEQDVLEPYDLVVLGDLLNRCGDKTGAVDRSRTERRRGANTWPDFNIRAGAR